MKNRSSVLQPLYGVYFGPKKAFYCPVFFFGAGMAIFVNKIFVYCTICVLHCISIQCCILLPQYTRIWSVV